MPQGCPCRGASHAWAHASTVRSITTLSRMGVMHARTPQVRAAHAAGAQRPCVRPGCRCRAAARRRTPRGAAAARRARRGARRARRTPARRRARRWRPCARASRGSRHACWPPHALRRRLWRLVILQRAAQASDHHSTHRLQIEKFRTVGSIFQYPDGTASYSTDCFRGFVAYSVFLLYNRAMYKSYELVRTTRNICLTTGKEGEGETPNAQSSIKLTASKLIRMAQQLTCSIQPNRQVEGNTPKSKININHGKPINKEHSFIWVDVTR